MEGSRLTDATKDPLQMSDVAAEHPEVVRRLRVAYQKWWKNVHEGKAPFARQILGADAAPSNRLHAMQWHYGSSP